MPWWTLCSPACVPTTSLWKRKEKQPKSPIPPEVLSKGLFGLFGLSNVILLDSSLATFCIPHNCSHSTIVMYIIHIIHIQMLMQVLLWLKRISESSPY